MVYDNYGAKGTADKAMPKIKPGGMCIATLAMTPVAVAIDKLVRTSRSDCDYDDDG